MSIVKAIIGTMDRRRSERQFQKKKAGMASSWRAWREFEKLLEERQPRYLKLLYDTVRKISQEVDIARTVYSQTIRWDEARERVLTHEFLERTAATYDKSHATIFSDIGKVSGHNAWMVGINRRGEYWILGEVMREMRECDLKLNPIIMEPANPSPILMTARQIKEQTAVANEQFRKIERDFLGGGRPTARTGVFDFMGDVDRQAKFAERDKPRRRPRKNWRREV
ncbi:MAG: hypothetical protein AAB450_02145 [Patescibacteria group bacterium]